MTVQRILVACIGNIFMGDDAFGVEVAKKLAGRTLPDGVRVVDFGIRGFDLAYAILDGYNTTIMVDVTQRGHEPGTLYLIEPDTDSLSELEGQVIEGHSMDPIKVLNMVKTMGGEPGRIYLVGCEPATFGPEEGLMGVSEPVQAAVDEAAGMVEALVHKLLLESRQVVQS